MINIISQFFINKIGFAKSMDFINVYLKNQNVIQHITMITVETIHYACTISKPIDLLMCKSKKKLVIANTKAKIHLGDSYMLKKKTHGTKKVGGKYLQHKP
jgi:hypothetical protein